MVCDAERKDRKWKAVTVRPEVPMRMMEGDQPCKGEWSQEKQINTGSWVSALDSGLRSRSSLCHREATPSWHFVSP